MRPLRLNVYSSEQPRLFFTAQYAFPLSLVCLTYQRFTCTEWVLVQPALLHRDV
jgi:hypothetical protein